MEHVVGIKLPSSWAQQPKVWFIQGEVHFQTKIITDDTTKYYHVVAAFDKDAYSRILDTLSAPQPDNKCHFEAGTA